MDDVLDRLSLDKVVANTHDGVFVLNSQQRFVYFNPACEQLTGYTADEVLSSAQTCSEITRCRDEHDRPLAGGLCPRKTLLNGEQAATRQLVRITTKGGDHRWVETMYTPLRGDEGDSEYIIGVMRDANEAKDREDRYQQTIEQLRDEVERLREQMREHYGFASIVTRSPGMQVVLAKTRSACGNSSPVLISGEPGTGKETIARTVHFNGLQKDGPFIVANVASIPRERIEAELFGYVRGSFVGATQDYNGFYRAADNGTLFIDGLENVVPSAQARLMAALQDKAIRPQGSAEPVPVHVRVIASVHRPMQDLLVSGALREDLVNRLSMIHIDVPPLRARKEDIPLLVHQFIGQLNQQSTRQVREVAPAVWAALDSYDWPGNAQELHNVIEAAFASGTGETLTVDQITLTPSGGRSRGQESSAESAPLDTMLADFERQAILTALRRARGQRSLAARLLGISRSRLYRRMDALGIAPKTADGL